MPSACDPTDTNTTKQVMQQIWQLANVTTVNSIRVLDRTNSLTSAGAIFTVALLVVLALFVLVSSIKRYIDQPKLTPETQPLVSSSPPTPLRLDSRVAWLYAWDGWSSFRALTWIEPRITSGANVFELTRARIAVFDCLKVLTTLWALLGYAGFYILVGSRDSSYLEQVLRGLGAFQIVSGAGE